MRINEIGNESDIRIPAELREVEQRLREDRPALTDAELEEIRSRATKSANQSPSRLHSKEKGTFMKSRLALLTILTLGVLMSMGGTGATLAVSSAASGSAGSAQYEPDDHEFCEEVGGSGAAGAEGCEEPEEPCAENGSSTGATQYGPNGEPCVEPAPSGNLPYTGFPVVPALLVGVGLLGAGVAMRRRMHTGDHFA